MVAAAGDRLGKIQPSSDSGHRRFQLSRTVARSDREKIILRILGLDLIDNAVHYRASNSHRELGEVDVRPLQCQDLADTKSQALRDNHHGAVGFRKKLEDRRNIDPGSE